ncbi:leucine-rich repeat extensin-like protein 3 [Ananas comosus]|uniref:Leucine-rich repeat extensin-like protein 3 n=1 Tax=Ananas comosus TaxID=4615 RepID=A0A6P5FM02_ANACO|nr:leucine-rich repeat extensin-like protein 3 [Ananas comosus]
MCCERRRKKVRLARQRLLTAQLRQRSYANKRRKDLEFAVGDCVFLKVSPMRGVKRFGIREKLSPRYIGPYEILERVGPVAYKLALPPKLAGVHNVFHLSNLCKYFRNSSHVLEYEPVELHNDVTYEEFSAASAEVPHLLRRPLPVKVIRYAAPPLRTLLRPFSGSRPTSSARACPPRPSPTTTQPTPPTPAAPFRSAFILAANHPLPPPSARIFSPSALILAAALAPFPPPRHVCHAPSRPFCRGATPLPAPLCRDAAPLPAPLVARAAPSAALPSHCAPPLAATTSPHLHPPICLPWLAPPL